MRATRRSLLKATLAAPLLPRFAKAAEFSLRAAHTAPLRFPLHIRLAEAAEQIAKESNGRVELQIFPDAQLGGDNDLLSQARTGAVDFCQPTGQILASILPVTAISALGFAWPGYDTLWPALDGELGAYIRKQITAKAGLVPMERMWDLGFRHVTTSTKPIRTADDLVGLKIQVAGRAESRHVVPNAESRSAVDAVHGGLLGAADTHRGCTGKPTDLDPGDEIVRGAEVLLFDQPCVGRSLVGVQRRHMERLAGCGQGCRGQGI